MFLSDQDINILSSDILNIKKIINGEKEIDTLTKPEIKLIIGRIKKIDKNFKEDTTKDLIEQIIPYLPITKNLKRKENHLKKNPIQNKSEEKSKKQKIEERSSVGRENLSNEERRIMYELEKDPFNDNHQDPYFQIIQILDVYWLKSTSKGFIHYSFPVDPKFDGKIHLQLYEYNNLTPKDWAQEISLKVNQVEQTVPQAFKRTKKQNKNILVIHNPLDITENTRERNNITISMKIPTYISFEGIIACLMIKELTTEELISQVTVIGKEEVKEKPKESSLIPGLSTPKFLNCFDEIDKGVKTKDISLIEKNIDNILKKNNQDTDIIVHNEEVISLKDILTLKRIEIASKSSKCNHRQCFDLKSYLEYSHQSKLWNCPICEGHCDYQSLIIDQKMNEIIKNVKSDKILMHEDGTYDEMNEIKEKVQKKKKKEEPILIEID